MVGSPQRVRKVTAVMLRLLASGDEDVLVIEHPGDDGGVVLQLPAGTVEPGEFEEDAALRALVEQTGVEATPRTLAGVLDEEVAGESTRRSIYLIDAPDGLPDDWTFTRDGGPPTRCCWAPFASATLIESQQPWLDLARAGL